MSTKRDNPADVKVIGIGLGRTGTASLRIALATLGFGPCYHMIDMVQEGRQDLPIWCKIGDGHGTPEDFDELFRGFNSIVDYGPAMYHAELFAAYPDAKFILTTRDPVKWEKSMNATVLNDSLNENPNQSALRRDLLHWKQTYILDKYHQGRLRTHMQQELLDHDERVKRIIPADKLLVYHISQGWNKLSEFLEVPAPAEPFPHVNDTEKFQDFVRTRVQNIAISQATEQP